MIWCEMCTGAIELNDCGVFTYYGNTILLCDECGRYILNLIEAYEGDING